MTNPPGWSTNVNPGAWVASNAITIGDVEVGAESSIWYGAVLRGDGAPISVGERSNVQDGSVIHTDPGFPVIIGNGVSIGHRAVLHGCQVGDDTLIGMGAIVMNGTTIGSGSIVGAGALLLEGTEVPANSLVTGAPAKVRRAVTAAELEGIRRNALTYLGLAELHRGHHQAEG